MLYISLIVVLIGVIINYVLIPVLTPQYIVHDNGIVLITGASTGIGNHAAIHIAKNSNLLVLAGVRKDSDINSIKNLNIKNLQPIIIDVTKHDSNIHAYKEIQQIMNDKNLPFVALINNAGISRSIPIEFHTIEDIKFLFETNFFGVIDLCQIFLPELRKSKGRIINISSIAGLVTPTMSGIYSASKRALEGLSDGLRRETHNQGLLDFIIIIIIIIIIISYYYLGISISVVNPGYIKTPIFESGLKNSESVMEKISSEIENVYGALLQKRIKKREKEFKSAVGPEHSTTAITDALLNKKPLTRYACAYALGIFFKSINSIIILLLLLLLLLQQ